MRKEARYVVRLANERGHQPADQVMLLERVRQIVRPLGVSAMNLRVSRHAVEFDLFCPPEPSIESPLAALASIGKVLTSKRLDLPPPPVDPLRIVTEARQLFNEERYWEVHETLEGLWKELKGPEKQWVQGLILAAAALVHAQKNQGKVVWPMLEDAQRRLQGSPDHYQGWDLESFLKNLGTSIEHKALHFSTV